jgi:hypothetical protein
VYAIEVEREERGEEQKVGSFFLRGIERRNSKFAAVKSRCKSCAESALFSHGARRRMPYGCGMHKAKVLRMDLRLLCAGKWHALVAATGILGRRTLYEAILLHEGAKNVWIIKTRKEEALPFFYKRLYSCFLLVLVIMVVFFCCCVCFLNTNRKRFRIFFTYSSASSKQLQC